MNLQNHKTILIVVTITLLLVAYSALQTFPIHPATELYTELWILYSNHKTENYPFNIERNTEYNMFLGIANHLGSSANYQVQLKLRNSTQPTSESSTLNPIDSPPIHTFTMIVAENETWVLPVTVSFDYTYNPVQQKINFESLTFNGDAFNIETYIVSLDGDRNGYYENLLFELWVQNDDAGSFEYNKRYVGLWFKIKP